MSLLDPSMEDLPLHLMVDILLRLPVKTIIHCKCVCKKWLDLILDSYFADQLLRSPTTGYLVHRISEKEMTYHHPGILKWVEVEDELDHHNLHHDPVMRLDLKLAPMFQKSQIDLVGSVDGLICLWQVCREIENTYICNPITREYMILPGQQYHRNGGAVFTHCFGVSSLSQEYKVIRIFRGELPLHRWAIQLQAEVYTLGTGQWRSIGHIPYRINGNFGPYLNGHAHWSIFAHGSPEEIYAFDFDNETFKLFPSPPLETIASPPLETIIETRYRFRTLAALEGRLCQFNHCDSVLTMWVMKEYGIKKSWHKEVIINTMSLNMRWPMVPIYPIKHLNDGTILMAFGEERLLIYSPHSGTFADAEKFDSCVSGMAYRPSFFKLHNFESETVHLFKAP